MRLVDYIADRIYELGVEHVFTVTGGGAMYLNDCVASHSHLKAVCNHHEQASAMAAVGYGKYSGLLGVAMVTTGCGSTNALTGVLDAWQDNVPTLFLSGQVNKAQTSRNAGMSLRQFGVQEADIIDVVRPMTKYTVMVNDPEMIAYHMDRAIHEAYAGRPGPVWLDIPLDIQGANIEPEKLKRYLPPEGSAKRATEISDLKIAEKCFYEAKRPIILAGNGIRLSGAHKIFQKFIEKHNIPVVSTFLGVDLLPTAHPLNIGRIGIKGSRAGNFAMQNADLILAIGTRLGVPVTGYRYELFAREAKLLVVDIDPVEHQKETVKIDHFIHSDAERFLQSVELNKVPWDWSQTCLRWKNLWPVFLEEHENDADGISLYAFMKYLAQCARPDEVVVSDAGSAYYVPAQVLQIEQDQRHITSGAQADMGFTIPASIGVSVAKGATEVIGITGDGSFQSNIQELQTIVHEQLPIKIFVWNNYGYLSIRTTQRKFFNDRFIGTDKASGVSFPDLKKIASAYGIKYFKVSKINSLKKTIKKVLKYDGPAICEVMCKKWDMVSPTISSKKLSDGRIISKPLEDMYPFLDREEFHENMIVAPLKDE